MSEKLAAEGREIERASEYVLVAPELVKRLSDDWSAPVQLRITERAADGRLELIARTYPSPPASLPEEIQQ